MNVNLTREAWLRFNRDIYPTIQRHEDNHFLHHILDGSLSFDPDVEDAKNPWCRPVLILTGKQDSCVGYEDQFQWLKFYPQATYLALEGAGF